MQNIFRSLSFTITQLVYPLIKTLYEMFYDIAKTEFFTVEEIRTLSGNIYIVISVCMLFALGLKLIGAIVNPELLTDQKKGVRSVALHAIFAVFLIVLLPIGFSLLYYFQNDIVENHLVEKIILGTDVSDQSEPGQILAAYAFYSFCQPNETISIESISNSGGDLYNKAISEDIELIKDMDGIINSKTDGKYDIEYHAILSPAVGLFLCYEMVLLCMDIALRTIKLGLLQLLAPLVLCGYVIKGNEILQKWAKEVGSTYVLLFLKIAMVTFMIYGLSLLPGFLDKLPATSHSIWYFSLIRVFVIIGLLQLIKQLPDIINTIFGTNIKSRGGIRGRLGEMAAVGNIAQNAWDQLRQHPIQSARRVLSAPVSAVGGYLSHRNAVNNRAAAVRQRVLDNGGTMRQARRAERLSRNAGMVGSLGAMFRAGRQGFRDGNLQGIGAQGRRYTDTHPRDSDFLSFPRDENGNRHLAGRAVDTVRSSLGMRTLQEQALEDDKTLVVTDEVIDPRTGQPRQRRMSFEQLQREQTQFNDARTLRDNILSTATKALERGDSTIQIDSGGSGLGSGTYSQLLERLNSYRENADSYGFTADDLAQMSDDLARIRESAIHQIVTQSMSGNDTFAAGTTLDGSGIPGVEISGVVNGGQFHDIAFQQRELNTKLQDIEPQTVAGVTNVNDWDSLDTFNIAAGNHQRELDHSVNVHNDRIANRVNSPEGRQMAASNDAVQASRNNTGGNSSSSNSGGH